MITNCGHARITRCLTQTDCERSFSDLTDVAEELSPFSSGGQAGTRTDEPDSSGGLTAAESGEAAQPQHTEQLDISGRLPTIQEENEFDQESFMLEEFYHEFMSEDVIDDDPQHEDICPYYVEMVEDNTVMFTCPSMAEDNEGVTYEDIPIQLDPYADAAEEDSSGGQTAAESFHFAIESDDEGQYVELCFTDEMSKVILPEHQQHLEHGEVATLRVYVTKDAKRAVVVKEDDLLTKGELLQHKTEVTKATLQELKIWLQNSCFKKCLLKEAENIMTSRYVAKWNWVEINGVWKKIIRMRLVLRGFMDKEAFSVETFAGTAKRTSQRVTCKRGSLSPRLDCGIP